MTPVDEVEQVSLSASDPLPSLNTCPQGVTAYEDGQGVIVRMCQRPVKQFLVDSLTLWLQHDPLEPTLPHPQKMR